jgi:hypothetical protein
MTAEDLGERIGAFIDASGHLQKEVTQNWLSAWRSQDPQGKELKFDYVESRLSKLKTGKPEGARFFFVDRRRGATLLDVLGVVDPQKRMEILDHGEKLANGHSGAKVLFDLTWAPQVMDPIQWTAIRQAIENADTPRPLTLLVRDDQQDGVPRSFDRVEGLTVQVSATVESVADLARTVVEDGGLVASRERGLAPLNQWVAIDLPQGGAPLPEHPPTWRASWRATGGLPAPTEAPHDLSEMDIDPTGEGAPCSFVGPRLRAYEVELIEGTASNPIPIRLRDALAFGVRGGATDEEFAAYVARRDDKVLAESAVSAGIIVESIDSAWLSRFLERARTRPLTAVWRVDADWHWVNVEPPAELRDHARVHVHTVTAPEPALTRLWSEVRGYTAEDRERDPLLRRAVERLDPTGSDGAAFTLARAWLLVDGGPGGWAAPTPVEMAEDADTALNTLLSAPALPASILLEPRDATSWLADSEISAWTDDVANFDALPRAGGNRRIPSKGEARRVRRNNVDFLERMELGDGVFSGLWPVPAFVPVERDRLSTDQWLNAMDEMLARETCGAGRAARFAKARAEHRLHCDRFGYNEDDHFPAGDWEKLVNGLRLTTPKLAIEVVAVDPALWNFSNRRIAQARRVLRIALQQGLAQRLADGSLLVPAGHGIDAHIDVTLCRDDEAWEGVVAQVSKDTKTIREADCEQTLTTASVEGMTFTSSQYSSLRQAELHPTSAEVDRHLILPRGIILARNGVCADIRFVPNPFTAQG